MFNVEIMRGGQWTITTLGLCVSELEAIAVQAECERQGDIARIARVDDTERGGPWE